MKWRSSALSVASSIASTRHARCRARTSRWWSQRSSPSSRSLRAPGCGTRLRGISRSAFSFVQRLSPADEDVRAAGKASNRPSTKLCAFYRVSVPRSSPRSVVTGMRGAHLKPCGGRNMARRMTRLRGSRPGQFFSKLLQDEAPNLAALLAWGMLSTLLPLLLGILAVAGLLLRDPQRLDQIYSLLLASIPQEAAQPIHSALDNVRATAGAAGLISVVLLLYNGSRLFATMQTVFNRAYYVDNRNFLLANAVAVLMLLVITLLLLISTVAIGAGSLLGGASDAVLESLPFQVPGRGLVGQTIS